MVDGRSYGGGGPASSCGRVEGRYAGDGARRGRGGEGGAAPEHGRAEVAAEVGARRAGAAIDDGRGGEGDGRGTLDGAGTRRRTTPGRGRSGVGAWAAAAGGEGGVDLKTWGNFSEEPP